MMLKNHKTNDANDLFAVQINSRAKIVKDVLRF